MLKLDKILIAAAIVLLGSIYINSRIKRKANEITESFAYNPTYFTPEPDSSSPPKAITQTCSSTYGNNNGTNIMNGQVGSFRKSSFSWTVKKVEGKFNIKSNAGSGSFNVVYSHYDSANNLHHYKPSGSAIFDNAIVKLVMSNGKLDQYAAGDLSSGNILSFIFTDNNGYIYKLGK